MKIRPIFFIAVLMLASHIFADAPANKKGGLLGSLFAVEQDEAIHQGNFLTGATLFLLQVNSDDDALNIIFARS